MQIRLVFSIFQYFTIFRCLFALIGFTGLDPQSCTGSKPKPFSIFQYLQYLSVFSVFSQLNLAISFCIDGIETINALDHLFF